MFLKISKGNFSCQNVTESAIDDLQNGNGPTMEIICDTPFKGTPDELAVMAVDYLNQKFQVERQFNMVYEDDSQWLESGRFVNRIVFQMSWTGF